MSIRTASRETIEKGSMCIACGKEIKDEHKSYDYYFPTFALSIPFHEECDPGFDRYEACVLFWLGYNEALKLKKEREQ